MRPPEERRAPVARDADVASVESIVAALYDTISGPAGARDWDRLRSLFLPHARLVPTGLKQGGPPTLLDVEGFIMVARLELEKDGFYEREIARRIERFGPIAHAWSAYESRRTVDGEPFLRGINSIQLVHDGGRWWVLGLLWANETPALQIPDEQLR